MNPDTRNLIAAICLSMSVLIGYQILFGEPTQQNVKILLRNKDKVTTFLQTYIFPEIFTEINHLAY